jgi:hypothetical protein
MSKPENKIPLRSSDILEESIIIESTSTPPRPDTAAPLLSPTRNNTEIEPIVRAKSSAKKKKAIKGRSLDDLKIDDDDAPDDPPPPRPFVPAPLVSSPTKNPTDLDESQPVVRQKGSAKKKKKNEIRW